MTTAIQPIAEISEALATRSKIEEFANELAMMPGMAYGDNPNCPLTHIFTEGIYTRQIFMPAGTVCVGKIHKHEHPNFLMKGYVSVVTEEGGIEHIRGPRAMVSPAGTQRAVYVHEDTTWITIHANPDNLTDLAELEELIIARSHTEIEKELPCHGF